ncbi:NHLP leader peptide family RiPP precursor [Haliangium sp.]|uniref:NHLP leader peptide family RiPP precursor n=1 Tax=Haliangium sp. TaxID=2663208 RepID=UPI003D0FBAE1
MSTSQGYTRHIQMTDEEVKNLHAWKSIVAKAWTDDAFRKALMSDPNQVLTDNGFVIPAGVSFSVVEDTDTARHLILPPTPAPGASVTELGKNSEYDPGF